MSRFVRPIKNIVRNVSVDMRTVEKKVYSYKDALCQIPETKLTCLQESGMKIATEESDKQLATIAVFIGSGSRFESPNHNGVANLFEHLAFKGTEKRSQIQLEQEVNSIGAHISAKTTRDHTIFQANCLKEEVPRVVEILADIIQHSKHEEKAIEREKKVILAEIEEAGNNLPDVAMDYLYATAFQGEKLGNSVLGNTEEIKNLEKVDIQDYYRVNYKPARFVVAGAGGVNHEELVELVTKNFDSLPHNFEERIHPNPGGKRFTGAEMLVRNDDLPFAHMAIGFSTVGWKHPDCLPILIASNIIGSWDRTYGGSIHSASKLAGTAARVHNCEGFQHFNAIHSDCGLWGTHYVCKKLKILDFTYDLLEEYVRIVTEATDFEVERAKNIMRTNLLISHTSTNGICHDIGKQVMNFGKRKTIAEFDKELEGINASTVRKAMMEHIYDKEHAIAALGPTEQLPEYNYIKARMYRFHI